MVSSHRAISPSHHDIFLQTASKIINIRTLQDHINPDIAASLLFLYALTGCDTVSRQYGIGKVMAMGKCDKLKDHAIAFLTPNQVHDNVNKHGLEVLYSCKPGHSLDFERAARFSSKVASRSTYLLPESLPPCDAVRYHSYRVYHQVPTWLGNDLDSTKWGWLLHKSPNVERLKPVKMRMDPVPASLLKLVKCNCHGKCDKNSCSCYKNGLVCSLACGHCKGITCNNAAVNNEAEHLGGHDKNILPWH